MGGDGMEWDGIGRECVCVCSAVEGKMVEGWDGRKRR